MTDARGKEKQDKTYKFTPCGLFAECETEHEQQGEPSQYGIEAKTYQIPNQMPFTRCLACCPQEQQHGEIAN